MADNIILKISRSETIESSRELAILRLDTGVEHLEGQPVMVRYYVDPEKTIVNSIFAIGIKNGWGRDCYNIVSLSQDNLIWGISYSSVSIENLTKNERYLEYTNSKWKLVYMNSNNEVVSEELDPSTSYEFRLITDMSKVVISNGQITSNSDYISTEELNNKLENYIPKDSTDYVKSEEGKSLSSNDFTDNYKESLDRVIDTILPSKITLSSSLESTRLKTGSTYNITFTWTISNNLEEPITSDNVRLQLPNGKFVDLSQVSNYYLENYTRDIPTTETFTIIAEFENRFITDTLTIDWCSSAFYGAVRDDVKLTRDVIASLNEVEAIKSIDEIGTVEYPNWKGKYIISYPKYLGELKSAVNEYVGYDDIRMFNEQEPVLIGDILYRVYSINVYTAGSINYKFS